MARKAEDEIALAVQNGMETISIHLDRVPTKSWGRILWLLESQGYRHQGDIGDKIKTYTNKPAADTADKERS